jgi:serine/threonine-protein phosphatase 6 regulatory ankyrin repeat subunit B
MCASIQGDETFVEYLLRIGANANERSNKLCNYKTSLMYACQGGHFRVVKILLEYGAARNTQDYYGCIALHYACHGGHLECMRNLLEYWADVSIQEFNGFTALQFACFGGHLECVRSLLECCADVNTQDYSGGTALHYACFGGHLECVRILLKHGAFVNTQDYKGFTALHEACQVGNEDVAILLIASAGCTCMNVKNCLGFTPFQWAEEHLKYYAYRDYQTPATYSTCHDSHDTTSFNSCFGN